MAPSCSSQPSPITVPGWTTTCAPGWPPPRPIPLWDDQVGRRMVAHLREVLVPAEGTLLESAA